MTIYHRIGEMPEDVSVPFKAALRTYFDSAKRPSYREIADELNGRFTAGNAEVKVEGEHVRDIFRRWRGKNGSKVVDGPVFDVDTPPPPEPEQLRNELTRVKEVNRRLYGQLQSAKGRVEDLVAATIAGARDATFSLGPIGPTPPPLRNVQSASHKPEIALMHMTDWQGAKVTTSYNTEVMYERVMRFCAKAVKITNIQRADHPITKAVLCLGGDMGEGLFNFPTQPYEVEATIFGQYVSVSRLIVMVVQFLLAAFDEVEVVAEWGNHGRIGSKRDAVPRSDNFDRMIYELARQLLASETRLTWADCPEDVQRLEIGNYRALLIHGDEIGRNGFASLNTILQHANRWKSGAYPWDFRDLYVGHYHVHYEMPMANGLGSVFGTGSTESDNRYAREMLAAAATPTQRLHFIEPEHGSVTAQYKIYVA